MFPFNNLAMSVSMYILHSKVRNIVNMVVNVSLAEEINLTHGYYVTNYSLLPIYRLIYDTTSLNMMMISQHATTFNCCKTFTARKLLWCYHQNDTWCMMGSKRTATRVMIRLVGFMYVLWELDIRKSNKNDMKFIPFKPFVIYLLDEWRTWYK